MSPEPLPSSDTRFGLRRAARAVFLSLLVAWALLAPSGVMLAAPPGKARDDAQGSAYWNDVRAAMRRGDYPAARRSLDRIRALTPDDPDVKLYQLLLQAREESPSPFAQLAPDELAALKRRLEDEEGTQRRNAAQLKALDRQVAKEQAAWDKESKRLQHEGTAKARAKRQRARPPETPHAPPAASQPQAGTPSETLPSAEAPASPERQPARRRPQAVIPSAPAAPGSVHLAPVTVEPPAGEETAPGLTAARVRPPAGAVQINANQMSVSPDRKVAIADGNVEVVFENALLTCDHLTLFTDTKDVYAEGRVRLEEGTQVFRGEFVHYNLENKKGRFLQGTVSTPPWHQHGRSVEHIAEGVYRVTPGYITSCELEPPHFRFAGRRATVFSDDKLARVQNAALFVEQVPFLYLPWISVADRKSPFFLIPGKRKPWGPFALMGYRYEPSGILGLSQKGTAKLDWRRSFGWGMGVDHELESEAFGKGLLKLYYNAVGDRTTVDTARVKGAEGDRYRLLWRHRWQPMPDTTVITDLQEYSDANFRKDFLFREEFTNDDASESFVSVVTNDPNYTVSAVARKRLNRFQSVSEALPQVTVDARQQRIGDTQFFSESRFDIANFQSKTAHSDVDADVIRADWFQQFSYALGLFRPIFVTPKAGIRQTYYTKDIQSGTTGRVDGDRNLISGQVNFGADGSLKLFRLFDVTTNALGLNLNLLRHVLTPTIGYSYIHRPTVSNDLLNFAAASGATNQISFGLENKLQTRRPDSAGKLKSVDLARAVISVPYTFRGTGNKDGGLLGDWTFDLELYPWPWMRLESDWIIKAGQFNPAVNDGRATRLNLDLVLVGGQGALDAEHAHDISEPTAPALRAFESGPQSVIALLPQGQWYLGLGHRYSQNDKTEDVLELDWRLSEKWEIGTFHRYTWKEVAGGAKRFNNLREYQYRLRRDLHDWVAELVWRVDREFGEEIFFTLTLKAYPEFPIEFEDSYHQPKLGSQSSPFSPLAK